MFGLGHAWVWYCSVGCGGVEPGVEEEDEEGAGLRGGAGGGGGATSAGGGGGGTSPTSEIYIQSVGKLCFTIFLKPSIKVSSIYQVLFCLVSSKWGGKLKKRNRCDN
jgi:hypothetical protein